MSPCLLDLLPGKVSGNLSPIKKTWPLSTCSMVGHRRFWKRSGQKYQHPYLCISLERCSSATRGLFPVLVVGACLPQLRLWPDELLYKAGSVKWAAHLPLRCPHNHLSPCCKREPRDSPCFLTTLNKFTKAGGSRALVIHILASATADVALKSTPSVYLCLPYWSNDKNREHSIFFPCIFHYSTHFPIKMHNPERTTPASEKLQAVKLKTTRNNFKIQ